MLQQMGLLSQEQASVRFGAWFDTATRKRTQAGSVFHFVNGIGLETASQLGDQGFLTICDVRAAYIDSEDALFNEEYKRLGLQYKSLRWALRPRLLAEYAVADAIIVPSAYVAETFCQNGIPSDKLHVLPFGVDLARFQMGVTSKHGKKDGQRFQALFVGRINPGKGVHYLIEAFGRLKLPKSQLLIVGRVDDAAYGRYLETLVEQYKVNVTFLGHLPQTDLWHIYQQSDLFVLPTLSEGSAMVVYEAMAAGLPILTTNHAGSVVADGEEGFIVPIRNSEAMEEKMHLLFKRTDLRQAMGKQSRLRVQDFSWEKYGQRLLSVYGKIWASRGTKQR